MQVTPENSIATPFVPRFQWQAVEGAKSFQLQVSTDSNFNPTDTDVYNTANTDFTPNANLSNDTDYFWRVKAIDQNGNETGWSAVRWFRTQWNFAPKSAHPAEQPDPTLLSLLQLVVAPAAAISDSDRRHQPVCRQLD